jgi:hypothetical protein
MQRQAICMPQFVAKACNKHFHSKIDSHHLLRLSNLQFQNFPIPIGDVLVLPDREALQLSCSSECAHFHELHAN